MGLLNRDSDSDDFPAPMSSKGSVDRLRAYLELTEIYRAEGQEFRLPTFKEVTDYMNREKDK